MIKIKTVIGILVLLAVVGGGAYYFFVKQGNQNTQLSAPEETISFDPLNASYAIEGQTVLLVNGRAEHETVPDSAIKTITSNWSEPVSGDLNNDGTDDAAFILTQDSGGSGTFFYVAVALNENGKARGINTILLGDRIAPQNISIKDGVVLVNYAVRNPDEPMAQAPSVGISGYYKVVDGVLQETQ